MFKKPTLTQTIKRDLAAALVNAHEHSKAAEHHSALMLMFTDRAQRLQERLDAMDSPDSKGDGSVHFPRGIKRAVAETQGGRP